MINLLKYIINGCSIIKWAKPDEFTILGMRAESEHLFLKNLKKRFSEHGIEISDDFLVDVTDVLDRIEENNNRINRIGSEEFNQVYQKKYKKG